MKLTQLARAVGAAALLTLAAGCGDVRYEPNGRRLAGSGNVSDGNGHTPDAGNDGGPDARDGGAIDSGPGTGKDAGPGEDTGPGRDGGPEADAGPDKEDGGGSPDAGRADGGPADGGFVDGGSSDGGIGDGGTPPACPVETCQQGVGICEATGRVVYDPSCSPVDCDAVEGAPTPAEDCGNGLDDDCNGVVNNGCVCVAGETQACYTGGEDTRNRGACQDGNLRCIGGGWALDCEGEVTPAPEICGNGVNEDCDDETDEGCGEGVPCFSGEGVCRTAGLTRADGTCDAVSGVPAATDVCGDGLDNNCRDGIDEGCVCPADTTQACYQGDEVTRGIGTCHDGQQTCIEGRRWSPGCDGQVLPSGEACDGVDNDCDGTTDEGCPCTNGQLGLCAHSGIVQPDGVCDAAPGSPGIEICNGADDNCNGSTDETFPEQDQPCTVGQGACENSGFVVCTDPALGAHCNVLPGTPRAEECNGLDDDCDSVTDEGCPCTVGLGICEGAGTRQADGTCDATPGDPDPAGEICNGLDDDCDGQPDDGLTRPCATICGAGSDICTDGVYVCDAAVPQPETCNGIDDNCDTVTDEENAAGCTIFYEDVDADTYGTSLSRCLCAASGAYTAARNGDCADGDAAINPGAAEAINTTDDNCNGWTDESAGFDARCLPGVSMELFGATPRSPDCIARELHQFFPGGESRVVITAGYDDPPATIAHATLVTLVPAGSAPYAEMRAIHRAAAWGFSARDVGITEACPPDLPASPPGKETRCFKAPAIGTSDDVPGSTVEFFMEP